MSKKQWKLETCGWYDNSNLYLSYLLVRNNQKYLFTYWFITRLNDPILMYIIVIKLFTHPTRPSSPRQQNREIHNPSYSPEKKLISFR